MNETGCSDARLQRIRVERRIGETAMTKQKKYK